MTDNFKRVNDNSEEETNEDVNVERVTTDESGLSGEKNPENLKSSEGELSDHVLEEGLKTSDEDKEQSADDELRSRFQEFFSEAIDSAGPKLTDTLLTYLELKNIDEELAEIEEQKGDLPEDIDSMKSQLNSFDARLRDKQDFFAKLEEETAKVKSDNDSFEAKINKYDEQKFDVRSNKEYDEIVKTIESLFEEVSKNESRVKEIDNVTGALKSEIDELSAKSSELKTELDEKQTQLNELDEQYMQEESVLKEKRSHLTVKLSENSLYLYEKINGMYNGEATAIVRKGNCSGCYNSIPPQRVIEIRSADKIYTCQSCGRILISEELIHS